MVRYVYIPVLLALALCPLVACRTPAQRPGQPPPEPATPTALAIPAAVPAAVPAVPSSPLITAAHSPLAPPLNACAQSGAASLDSGDMEQFANSLNTLGVDLYQLLIQNDSTSNLIFSPYGVVSAFSMAYAGAEEETAAEMRQYLHFLPHAEQATRFQVMNCYLASLAGNADEQNANEESEQQNIPFQLRLLNGAWVQEEFPLAQAYRTTITEKYSADLQSVDFATNPARAIDQINQWVQEGTEDRISELMSPNEVNSTTRLVLANAAYFKAAWLLPFRPSQTQPKPFTLLSGDPVEVPMMHQTRLRAPYMENEQFQAVLLPYVGRQIEMVIILPRREGGADRFAQVEQALDAALFAQVAAGAALRDITMTLPKFEIQNEMNLVSLLAGAGLRAPFSTGGADFSGITGGDNGLYISAALQHANITVDERGTEAAAATGIAMVASALTRAEFTADHPFIYALRAKETGTILFMGRVVNPAE